VVEVFAVAEDSATETVAEGAVAAVISVFEDEAVVEDFPISEDVAAAVDEVSGLEVTGISRSDKVAVVTTTAMMDRRTARLMDQLLKSVISVMALKNFAVEDEALEIVAAAASEVEVEMISAAVGNKDEAAVVRILGPAESGNLMMMMKRMRPMIKAKMTRMRRIAVNSKHRQRRNSRPMKVL